MWCRLFDNLLWRNLVSRVSLPSAQENSTPQRQHQRRLLSGFRVPNTSSWIWGPRKGHSSQDSPCLSFPNAEPESVAQGLTRLAPRALQQMHANYLNDANAEPIVT